MTDSNNNVGMGLKKENPEANILESNTLYLGNVPVDTTPKMIFDAIGRPGPVEALRILPEKHCAFLDMVHTTDAQSLMRRKTTLRGHPDAPILAIRPAKPSLTSTQVRMAIKNGASRSLYIALGMDIKTLESIFSDKDIDTIRTLPDRNIAFVHFISVADAIDGMERFIRTYPDVKVNFADDRSAPSKKRLASESNEPEEGEILPSDRQEDQELEAGEIKESVQNSTQTTRQQIKLDDERHKRTIFLGGISSETTLEDLADVVRGGPVESLRLLIEKNSAFVSFIDHDDASKFFEHANQNGLYIRGDMVKRVSWGDQRILPGFLTAALKRGASRVLFLGNLTPNAFTEEKLWEVGAQFGCLERVKIVKERGLAFISFGELRDAVKAQEALSQAPEFQSCRVTFGKDKCSDPLPKGRPMGFYVHRDRHNNPLKLQALQSLQDSTFNRRDK